MDELIRDPLWTFVGVILALLAVVVTISIYFAQRKKKRLSYDVISNTQLLGVKDEIQGKVKVLYEGNEVKNVHLLTLKFTNTGNQPISSSDYERPLTIKVNDGATILTHEIIDEEPENLDAELTLKGNNIVLSPLLLNSKDSFSVKALISDFEGHPEIDGRINGVKSIAKYGEGQISFVVITMISLVLIAVGAPNLGKDESFSLFSIAVSRDVIGGVFFVFGYVLMFIAMLRNKRALKIMREVVRGLIKSNIR